MSRSNFVKFKDFEELLKLSVFVSTLKKGMLISIESITLDSGVFQVENYRVWYFTE